MDMESNKSVKNVRTYGNEDKYKKAKFKLIKNSAAIGISLIILITLFLNRGIVYKAITNWDETLSNGYESIGNFFSGNNSSEVSEEIEMLLNLTTKEYNDLTEENRKKAILVRYTYVANEIAVIGEKEVIEVKNGNDIAYIDPYTLKEIIPLGVYKQIDNTPIMLGNRTVLKALAGNEKNEQTAYLDASTLKVIIPLGKYSEIGEMIKIGERELLLVSNGQIDENRLEAYLDSNTLEEVIPLSKTITIYEQALDYVLITLADGSQKIISITPIATDENNKKLN